MLTMLIRMIESQGMAQLMEKDTANVDDRLAIGAEMQIAAIGIKGLVLIKIHVGFYDLAVLRKIRRHSENAVAEGIAGDGGREKDGVDVIARGLRSAGIEHVFELDGLHDRVPGIGGWRGGGIPGRAAVLKRLRR